MNVGLLLDMLDTGHYVAGLANDGDLLVFRPGSAPTLIEWCIQTFTGQPEIHAAQVFELTPATRAAFAAVNIYFADDEDYCVCESTLDVEGLKIVDNGPTVTPLRARLVNEGHITALGHWRTLATPDQVAAMVGYWCGLIAGHTVYGVGQILLLAAWKTAVSATRARLGWWGWVPWWGGQVKAQLEHLLAHPPVPLFNEQVCSTSAAASAVTGCMADLNRDGAWDSVDARLAYGVTPGDLLALPEIAASRLQE